MSFLKLPGSKGKVTATKTPQLQGPPKGLRKYPSGPMPALTVEQHLRRASEDEQKHRDTGVNTAPARLYTVGESACADAAIMLLKIQTTQATTWWDLVGRFLDYGSTASAKIAMDHAVKPARWKPKRPKKHSWSWLKALLTIAGNRT